MWFRRERDGTSILARLKRLHETGGFADIASVDLDGLGVVYATEQQERRTGRSELVFVPMARIRAALAGRK